MPKSLKITNQHLIIFTRYPEPGKTKTRLIPALGSVGAANLQREMTEYTISQALELQEGISIEVRFAGGNLQLMQEWLGSGLLYQCQGDGDLGVRMGRSLADAFQHNAQTVVIIGTDCPEANDQILAQAFTQLQTFDLVLGPAIDGGYYLIGLRRYIPELFCNIDWGTSQVLQQTIDIANQLHISYFYLPTLADIDRREDLLIWQRILNRKVNMRQANST
ncbi:TIGR04282 family arsenosugar biosynthesis glycosyltransferase [Anabaena sp. 4-3]|uniref:TIGR04282 family arsenosugar biosynthesis glycosyltransferase n=1 Tax=Anabaena sp. 4-3 TaxID=1811979 RepID=UPI0008298617|nr:TIGR04282 family arsenosugar biosynthesis glycosyltransferase [Anabaena sp. 4-3]